MTSLESFLTPSRAQALNLLGDAALLVGASVAATLGVTGTPHYLLTAGLAASATACWMGGARALRHYDVDNGRRVLGDIALTVFLLAFLSALLGLARATSPDLRPLVGATRFLAVLVPGVLWLRSMMFWVRHKQDLPPEDILVVGTGPLGRMTALDIRDAGGRRRVMGFLRFECEEGSGRIPAPVLGHAAALERILREHVVNEVYIAFEGSMSHEEAQEAIRTCERFGIPFALPACNFRLHRAKPRNARGISDGYVHYLNVHHKPVQLAIKRAIDILASAAALLALSPLLLAVAAAIKLTSRGPVFFAQERVGHHGRRFRMLKFRSMVVNAEELKAKLMAQNEMKGGPAFKMKHDPRITGIGRFIRQYSIDELPQLINVLRGDMTLVGPRPSVPSEVASYEAWQRRRLSVRPGITCVWQVSGRNNIPFEQWMYLDMQYIDNWSLAQDLSLLVRTVPAVITGRGAS